MPKAGGCRGWRITSQWWKKAWSFILLSYRTLQNRARRDNFHYLFEGNLHFVFLPSRTLEILQLATETSVIMKTKLKFAEDIDVRPCAELRTSPSAANLFARSTWIRDNFFFILVSFWWRSWRWTFRVLWIKWFLLNLKFLCIKKYKFFGIIFYVYFTS